ncbi:hypothetical protein ACOME3_001468 [Neoechinorhynchus agilis]
MHSISVTATTIQKALNVVSIKQLDRRFLINPATIRSCVKTTERFIENTHLIHLHPGFGSLSSAILSHSKPERMDLIESDRRLMPYLQRLANERVLLHMDDPVQYLWSYISTSDLHFVAVDYPWFCEFVIFYNFSLEFIIASGSSYSSLP